MKRILICMVVLLSLTAAFPTYAQDSLNVIMVGHIDTPGQAMGVVISGNYAYVADRYSGLRVINISDPFSPYEAGYYDTPGQAQGVAVSGGYVYVADHDRGLEIFDFSEVTMVNERLNDVVPVEFNVGSAYPNPFNPAVTVPFALPQSGKVSFAVYDLLGREVNKSTRLHKAGYHRFVFNASESGSGLVSGAYYLQVRYGGEVRTQKIIMMK